MVKSGRKQRRVAGGEGLGRLSAGSIGNHLHMLTQATEESCWEVNADWDDISKGDDSSGSFVEFRHYPKDSPFKKVRYDSSDLWLEGIMDDNQISDLEIILHV